MMKAKTEKPRPTYEQLNITTTRLAELMKQPRPFSTALELQNYARELDETRTTCLSRKENAGDLGDELIEKRYTGLFTIISKTQVEFEKHFGKVHNYLRSLQ